MSTTIMKAQLMLHNNTHRRLASVFHMFEEPIHCRFGIGISGSEESFLASDNGESHTF